jgi:predicted NUDIX family NTP pyrophosphohydrolase
VTAQDTAGILLWRDRPTGREVWIGHMGGPWWSRKPEKSWSIPKGLLEPGENRLDAARREFAEEMGHPAPDVDYALLGEYPYSRKRLIVFVGPGDGFDPAEIVSNTFEIEWPPRTGERAAFPEMDRAAWMSLDQARRLLVPGQLPMLDDLAAATAG